MSRLRSALTYEIPRQPEPQTFRVDRMLERHEIDWMRVEPAEFRRELKRRIAQQLAAYIAETTQLIDLGDDPFSSDTRVRVEVTFHDRGTYENWLPQERRRGHSEGVKDAIDALPYGVNPQEQAEC